MPCNSLVLFLLPFLEGQQKKGYNYFKACRYIYTPSNHCTNVQSVMITVCVYCFSYSWSVIKICILSTPCIMCTSLPLKFTGFPVGHMAVLAPKHSRITMVHCRPAMTWLIVTQFNKSANFLVQLFASERSE